MHRSVLKDQKYDSGKNEHKTADGAIGARVEERKLPEGQGSGTQGKNTRINKKNASGVGKYLFLG